MLCRFLRPLKLPTASLGSVQALALCAAWGVSALAAQPLEPLGTLLYSPAQRQAVVAARKSPTGVEPSPLLAKPTTTRLDGVVARADTKGTQIRGTQAIVEGQRLRVGESVDTLTGAKTDIVAPGAVRKGQPP